MDARIFRPAKSAMQSGRGKTQIWVLEFMGHTRRAVDPVMGWTSVDNTENQVRLTFESREQAIAYARREKLTFKVEEARETSRLVKSYARNFSADRKQPWAH